MGICEAERYLLHHEIQCPLSLRLLPEKEKGVLNVEIAGN